MVSLLDVLGATVIGAILILSMINAQYNIQAMSLDIRMYVNLFDISDNTVSVLESYLSKVGFGVDTTAIIAAAPDSFEFRAKFSLADSTFSTLSVVQGDSIADKGYPFQLKRNGVTELGPFYLSNSLRFTYYDADGNTTSVLANIRSVKSEMEFFYASLRGGINIRKYKHRITFWKYFKNLYLD